MNSFLEWMKPGLGLKRWMLLMLSGIGLMVYSLSVIIAENTPEIKQIVWVVVFFIIGFVLIVYAIIKIQKRTLEIFIESSGANKELKGKNVDLKSLIFDKDIFDDGAKVVVLGGGTGLNTIISGLKKYTNNITAIVTLSDYHNDESRKALNTLPYSDIKESLIALSNENASMKKLMELNFTSKRLEGLNFGDIFLLAMEESYGNIPLSIRKSGEVLNIIGDVIPCSADEIKVCAELTDGTNVETKEQIPLTVMEKVETIKRIYLKPTNARVTPSALKAIEEADLVVIGPGNLYTNIIPNLLVKNISQTIKESKAIKVYISNIMTDKGQTDGYSLSEHIRAIFDHSAGKIFDYVIADKGNIIPEYLRAYHKDGEDIVEIDEEIIKRLGVKLIQKDVSKISQEGRIRHDGDSIAVTLMEILMSDLKFQDLGDEKIKTTLLDAVLKSERKKEKIKQKKLKKAEKAGKKIEDIMDKKESQKFESKFAKKYKDRLKNIRTADKKAELEKLEEERQKEIEEKLEKRQQQSAQEKQESLLEKTKDLIEKEKEEDIKAKKESIFSNENIEEKAKVTDEKIKENKPEEIDKLEKKQAEEISDNQKRVNKLKEELKKLENFRMKNREKYYKD